MALNRITLRITRKHSGMIILTSTGLQIRLHTRWQYNIMDVARSDKSYEWAWRCAAIEGKGVKVDKCQPTKGMLMEAAPVPGMTKIVTKVTKIVMQNVNRINELSFYVTNSV